MLWQYLNHMIARWKRDVIVMGDFNEVRFPEERFGSNFNANSVRESNFDYGPTPFRFFHYWFEFEGFDSFVENTWKDMSISEPNSMLRLLKKLRSLKGQIRLWVKDKNNSVLNIKKDLKSQLTHIDASLDKGDISPGILDQRSSILNHISSMEKNEALELAQKAKVKWSIEGDKNTKFFHGIINKQRNNLVIRGIIVDGNWIEDPKMVKNKFLSHFADRFKSPCDSRFSLDMEFPNKLNVERITDLEQPFMKEEIKGAVWDCGLNRSPGPDGFTFGFFRRYWSILEADVVNAVSHFFDNGYCPKGGNSSFITLILKSQGAKQVKDFRPISLIGSKKKQTMIFKVNFEKEFDFVRWDFFDDVLKNFDFGVHWRNWIQSCLKSLRGSILVNGSPTAEFQFYKGVSLNSSMHISYLFYVDDVVFLGQWSDENLITIVCVLECFFHASGLRINLHKSKLLGLAVDNHIVHIAANNLGCLPLSLPFNYLGVKVGVRMSSISSWEDVFNKVRQRLSKWKINMLSIGGRLTLLKSVLGSMPSYFLSMFKAPHQVLKKLETFRSHFFNGINLMDRKATFIKWDNVLVAKKKGCLRVSSFYALNRALIFKWIWRFRTQNSSLWGSVIKAIYGIDGMIGNS
ncbi:RNA-directed DNA polymerase, eukaryota, partial [Tanacetum coccineum]